MHFRDTKPGPSEYSIYAGAEARYNARIHLFRTRLEHDLHWKLHNCIVHPMLGLKQLTGLSALISSGGIKLFNPSFTKEVQAHQVSSAWLMNKTAKEADHDVENPVIYTARQGAWWVVHNCLAHPAIGFFPKSWAFKFHDWTAEKMAVTGWV